MPAWKKIILAVLLIGSVLTWRAVFTNADGTELVVSFLDVGQGDAALIKTPGGKQILIDGGPNGAVLRELGEVMPGYDKSIDLIIATHTDLDHLGGLVDVLRRYDVTAVIENGFEADTQIYKEWESLLEEKRAKRIVVSAGDKLELDNDVTMEFFGPSSDDWSPKPDKANEVMIVSRLVYGENEFFFAGDLERGDEVRLASSNIDLTSDVLKVAHHGSKNASTDLFLEDTHSEYFVISVGGRNNYGHPAPETLERLKKIGGRVLRTDEDGRITFKGDGHRIAVVK